MKKVLITGSIFDEQAAKELSQNYDLEFAPADVSENELIGKLKRAVVYVMGGSEKVTAVLVNSAEASALRLIVFLGVQPETFFTPDALKLLEEKRIKLESTPAANSNAVAEMTLALLLAQLRQIPQLAAEVRHYRWPQIQTNELAGKTFGILGMGKIGYLVGQKMRALGMNIIYTSRRPVERADIDLGARMVEKNQLFEQSDVVSLHLPLLPATEKIVSLAELKLMKPDAILMNTARAWLVDPKALLKALDDRVIASAIFDGYYVEGSELFDGDPYGLLELPSEKFLCTPHQAFNTAEANQKASEIAKKIIEDFMETAAG